MDNKPIANLENETALLAHTIRHAADYPTLADIVKPEDFSWNAFGWVWDAMGTLSEAGMHIDAISVGDELERMGKLSDFCGPHSKQFTGRVALSMLREVQTTREGGETYALTVQDYARKRDLYQTGLKMLQWASNGRSAGDIVHDVESQFSKLVMHSGKVVTHTMGMEVAVARAADAVAQARTGGRTFKTGINGLDRLLGVQKTELVVLAARPGQGKTALLCTVLLNAAKAGKRGLLFSIEMGGVPITQRLLSQLSGINAFRLINGALREEEEVQFQDAMTELQSLPLIICDLPAIRIGQVRTEARKHDIDFIMLDYVQLANADRRNDRRDLDIGEVTRGLKALAKELDIPVIAAAQLNRASETRSEKKPQLGDLRESGSIENDADIVVFIHRPDVYGTTESKRQAELIIAKHRNGPVGTANTMFFEDTMRFADAEVREINFRD